MAVYETKDERATAQRFISGMDEVCRTLKNHGFDVVLSRDLLAIFRRVSRKAFWGDKRESEVLANLVPQDVTPDENERVGTLPATSRWVVQVYDDDEGAYSIIRDEVYRLFRDDRDLEVTLSRGAR